MSGCVNTQQSTLQKKKGLPANIFSTASENLSLHVQESNVFIHMSKILIQVISRFGLLTHSVNRLAVRLFGVTKKSLT